MKSIFHIMAIIFTTSTTFGVDGIAFSYKSERTNPYGLHSGSLVRHIVRKGLPVSDSFILDGTRAREVCLSPGGARIAFVRVEDGMLCIAGIDGSRVAEMVPVSPDSKIDWTNEQWIYYTTKFNHPRLNRIRATDGEIQNVGWFPVGAIEIEVSAASDSVRGIAVLDSENVTNYTIATFDYRVFLINKHIGCGGSISPTGSYYSIETCPFDSALYNRAISIYRWEDETLLSKKTAPDGEFFARNCWAVNSDEWMVITVGKQRELLVYHDMMIFSRDMSRTVRITANDSGSYNEGCDFWVGNPDSALAKASQLPANTLFFDTKPASHTKLFLRADRDVNKIFTLDGRFRGCISKKAVINSTILPNGAYIAQTHKVNQKRKNKLILIQK